MRPEFIEGRKNAITNMTYPEAIKYLNSFIDYEKISQYPYGQSFKLERIEAFLKILNNPQDDLRFIHIAGTKGKGSTSAFIAYILREAGSKVGLYTSPHLSDFRERIRILNPRQGQRETGNRNQESRIEFEGLISERELIDLVEELRPYIEEYNSQSRYGALSFFEVYTTLAFKYFRQERIDFAILETGLGGRLDATNIVNPLIAAITPISYEHTRLLGETLSEIAREKAGIIKNSSQLAVDNLPLVVISAPQNEEVMEIIRDRCRKQNAILYELGKDIIFQTKDCGRNQQCFNINGALGKWVDLRIRLLGRHQVVNATLAVAVILVLIRFYQLRANLELIRAGLYNTIWPGRFEIISERPSIVLDGAQNVASAQALQQTVVTNFPDKRIILVLGISQDKDIKGICRVLVPMSNELILTQADNPRAGGVDMIEQAVSLQLAVNSSHINKTRKVKEAIELAVKKANPEDLILVTGSLFLVGEARDFLLRSRDTFPIGSKSVP